MTNVSILRPTMSFVGREHELAQLLERMTQPECRLITLVGAGGIGKTRLAGEAAQRFAAESGYDPIFVPLDTVEDPRRLPGAIAEATNIRLSGTEDPEVQLFRAFAARQALLVLDNFEHLIEGASLVSSLLREAPRLKVLVTSREALNVREEWRYAVTGLSVPPAGPKVTAEDYASVRLFDERARQVQPDFALDRERDHVIEICRLVDGMPLAIELAASWIRLMSPQEVAAEIRRGLDVLSTTARDVPERHRTMRAVLDESWKMMSESERVAFRRLSVFRGGFDRQAAQQVTGVDPSTLLGLIDKSIVTPEAQGRFQIHELLRHYAEERLLEDERDAREVADRHCAYFAELLDRNLSDDARPPDPSAVEVVAQDIENVLAGWSRAMTEKQLAPIGKCVRAMELFFQFRSQYADGLDLMERTWAALHAQLDKDHAHEAVRLLNGLAWLSIRVGRLEQAERWLDLWDGYLAGDDEMLSGLGTDPYAPRAIVAIIRGEYAEAKRLAQLALERSERTIHASNKAIALYALAEACMARGDTQEALAFAQQACETSRSIGDRWFLAYCLITLGNALQASGDPAEATDHYESAFALREGFGDREGMAIALNHLGTSALQMQQVEQAVHYFRRAVDLYRGLGDPGGLSASLHGLGDAALAAESSQTAARYLREALEVAHSIGFVPRTLAALTSAARLLAHVGSQSRAADIAAFVAESPSSQAESAAEAKRLLESLRAAPRAAAGSPTLEQVVGAALADLRGLEEASAPSRVDDRPVIPLSEREREVLRALAQGLSNREIAEQLIVSAGTVKAHTHSIYRKLGTDNRVQAIERARDLGLLPAF